MLPSMREGRVALLVLLLGLGAVADETDDGIDAAVQGDWATACECFARASGDVRSPSRLSAARAQAVVRLGPAIEQLTKQKRWGQLAEVAACGLAFDASNYRYSGAATRAAREGATVPAASDARIRAWAAYGPLYGDSDLLRSACVESLMQMQEPEGHWDCEKQGGRPQYTPGVSGLALLALAPLRREPADRAAQAILRMQDESGRFGSPVSIHYMYNHAIATEAIADYAVRTGLEGAFRSQIQRAVDVLAAAQNPGAGWRYAPRGGENDTSITSRCLRALCAAERAGATVDPACRPGARKFVLSMRDAEFGQIGYVLEGGTPARPPGMHDAFPPERSQSMTAAGSLALLLAGTEPQRLARSFALIQGCPPEAKYPDFYYWESGAEAWMLLQGRLPPGWYEALVNAAVAQRAGTGGIRTSDPWCPDGGRVYATAMVALALGAACEVRPSRLPTASAFRKAGHRTVTVPGGADPMPTGIYVEAGMVLAISGKGVVTTYRGGPGYNPAGSKERPAGSAKPRDRSAPYACLLACIDDGKPFPVQVGKQNTMRGFGHLWLRVNDDTPTDNSGEWEVEIDLVR